MPPFAASDPPRFDAIDWRSASMRSMTSPPSSSSGCSPNVAAVSIASPCSSFASMRVRSSCWYSSTNWSGSKSDTRLSTSCFDRSSSFDEIFTGSSSDGNFAARTSSLQSSVCTMSTSPYTRSAASRVFCRSAMRTIAVLSVDSSVRRSST